MSGCGIAVVSGVPMQEATDATSGGTITVEQQHHARAAENASMYRQGDVLRGKSLYLLSDAPDATVQEVVRTDDGPPVTVDVETEVVYRVQYSGSEIHRERGVSARETGELPDGNVTASMELDMTRIRDRLRGLRGEFGGETSVQAVLATRVEFDSQSSSSIVFRTPITFTSKGYHIPTATERRQYGVFETVREPVPERTVSVGDLVAGYTQLSGLGIAVAGLALVGIGLGYLRRLTEGEKAELYRRVMHRRFSEFMATVESGACPAVDREMDSLQDLVFVGEDGGEPVLYFPDVSRYVVQCDGTVYGYQFDAAPFQFGNDPD